MTKLKIDDLPPVAQTLVIPLSARARESTRPDCLLSDPKAVELMGCFDIHPAALPEQGEVEQACILLRARHFDRAARDFLRRHPEGMLVDLGCGLDTRFYRLDDGKLLWVGLDLPEVIHLRRGLLPETPRSPLLAASAFDLDWLEVVRAYKRPVIFLAEGLFPYFTGDQVKTLLLALIVNFTGAELVFDALSPFSVWAHQKAYHQLDTLGIHLGWGLRSSGELMAWDRRIRVLEEWHYFEDKEPRIGWYNLMQYFPFLARMNWVLHCRLGGEPLIET